MKHVINLVFLLVIASLVACDNKSQNTSTKNTAKVATPSTPSELPQFGNLSSIVKQPLKVTDWAYAVPLQGISTVNVWKKAGAKNTPQNQVVATLNESTRVGILERQALSSRSIYFHIELEDGKRGFVGRPFISRDVNGNAFYEQNSATGEVLRDGKGYSFSQGENCILHVAALMTGDLRKGEFETTAEFEKRKSEVASTIPWFSDDITYTYVYPVTGEYDADKQTFEYSDYYLPDQEESRDYPDGDYNAIKTPYLEFDNDCTDEFGYRYVSWEEGYEKKSGKADTLLHIRGATIPDEFIGPESYSSNIKVKKLIARADARRFKNTKLFLGVSPKTVQSVRKGSNGSGYRGPSDHRTKLGGDLSYIFLITADGKDVVESYVSATYKKTWQRDLQSQLVIAGYDVGIIDGFAGDATKKALISAAADGLLPNAEMSMRATMMLINHNRIK